MRVAGLVVAALAACNSSGGYSKTTPAPGLATSSAERAPPSTGPVEFKTAPPQRLDRFSALPLSSEEEYRKTTIALKDRLVPIRVEPADLREPALYGFNVILDGSNRSVIVDGDEQQGYRLFVDLDGDGDLQEERPRHFIANNGPPTVVLEPTAAERGRDPGTAPAPILVFEVRAPVAQGEAPFSVWKSDHFTGHMREFAEFRGKWVVIDFWAPWCQPCVRAAPELKRAQRELGPRGLEIIGVHDGEPDETARKFIHDNAMSWPQLIDADQAAQSLYRVDALPAYVVIDPGGTIVARGNTWSSVLAVLDERLPNPLRG